MDRLCDYIHNVNIRDKRNMISSISAGFLVSTTNLKKTTYSIGTISQINYFSVQFAVGWWIAIDAACAYPDNNDLLKASHVCGALGTIAFIM